MNLDDKGILKVDLSQLGGTFLEANLSSLNVPLSLQDTLRDHQVTQAEVKTSRNGVPFLKLKGLNVYDEDAPINSVMRQVELIEAEDKADVLALFGFGLGYHAEQFERRFQGPIVVYDPSLDALATGLGAGLLRLERTTVVSSPGQLLGEVQPRLQFSDRKLVVAAIPAYRQLFPQEFSMFKKIIEQSLRNSRISEQTVSTRMREWVENVAHNLPRVASCKSIDVLRGRFAGKPGVLVSAGPSLDRNIDLLSKVKGHSLIVSVNTAVRSLSKAGVVPDIVTVVEALDVTSNLSELEHLDQMVLAPTLNSSPGLFNLPVKHVLPIADLSVPCSEWLYRAFGWHRFLAGGSVACTAFAILHELGCDPIILVGQDLAYTKGESYAQHSAWGKLRMKYDEETMTLNAVERNKERELILTENGLSPLTKVDAVEVDAYGGKGKVSTIEMFNLFRTWFEAAADTWAGDRTLVNATEGGARIAGFQEMPLCDAVEKWCKEPLPTRQWIDDAIDSTSPSDIGLLAEVVREDMDAITQAGSLARQAQDTATDILAKLEKENLVLSESIVWKIEKLEKTENALREVSHEVVLLDAFVAGEVNQLRVERKSDEDEDPTRQIANSLNRSIKVFGEIARGADELRGIFCQAQQELRQTG